MEKELLEILNRCEEVEKSGLNKLSIDPYYELKLFCKNENNNDIIIKYLDRILKYTNYVNEGWLQDNTILANQEFIEKFINSIDNYKFDKDNFISWVMFKIRNINQKNNITINYDTIIKYVIENNLY